MKLKKILASVAAASLAVTSLAVASFAYEITGSGDWALAGSVPIDDLKAIGGDVKVTLTYTIDESKDSHIFAPAGSDWDHLADQSGTNAAFSSTDFAAKPDGFFLVRAGSTSGSFVISEEAVNAIDGLYFQIYGLTITDAEIEAGELGDELARVSDEDTASFYDGTLDPWASDSGTTSTEFSANITTALYVGEQVNWTTAKSDEVAVNAEGEYTYSIDGLDISKDALTVIYIKDVAVENGDATVSDIDPIALTYGSLKINGEEVAIAEGAPTALSDNGTYDFCLYNIWGDNYIEVPDTINSVELTVKVAAAGAAAEEPEETTTEEETTAEETTAEETTAEETTVAAETAAPSNGDTDTNTGADKNSATGVAIAVIPAIAAAAGVMISRKRK